MNTPRLPITTTFSFGNKFFLWTLLCLAATTAAQNTPNQQQLAVKQQQQRNESGKDSYQHQKLSTLVPQDPSILKKHNPFPSLAYNDLQGLNSSSLSDAIRRTFIRSNKLRVYHLDLHAYRPDAKYEGDPEFVDSQNPEHVDRCRSQLSTFHKQLQSIYNSDPIYTEHSNDAIKLADTFGRPESGLLMGNQFWLGSYRSCRKFKLNQNVEKPIKGHYCLAIMQFPDWDPQLSKSSIKVGTCLPESCTSSMINEDEQLFSITEAMIKFHTGHDGPFRKLRMRQVYCLPHKTSEVRKYSKSALLFLAVAGLFLGFSVVFTLIDYLLSKLPDNLRSSEKRSWTNVLIDSFSITRNFNRLMTIRESSSSSVTTSGDHSLVEVGDEAAPFIFERDTFLNATSGLKCIGLFWIICGHSFLVTPITSRNILFTDSLTKTYLADIFLTAHLMVDTFFTISGVLASYFIFKDGVNKITNRGWVVLTIHRYWRLTPIYLLSYWFTKSVGFLVNDGPLWDYKTSQHSPRLNCAQESWLTALLHLSDFKSPKEHCVPFAWFIANGIKFWMVTPFFIVPIYKSMRKGYMITGMSILFNIVLVVALSRGSNVDFKSVIEFKPESADNMLNNMGEVYSRPYSRVGTYLIGLLAGHMMYLSDTKQMEVRLPRYVNTAIWTLFTILVVALTFVLKIAKSLKIEGDMVIWLFSISSALIRPIWALCTCWFLFAIAHGQVKWMANFLTANCWKILVKLSFCAYLAQGEVIAQLFLSSEYADSFTYLDMISRPLITLVVTLAASLVMKLTIEDPLLKLEEIVMPKRAKNDSQQDKAKVLNGVTGSPIERNKLKAQ